MRIPPHKADYVIEVYKKRMIRNALGRPLSGDIEPSVFIKKTNTVLKNARQDMAARLLKQIQPAGQGGTGPDGPRDASEDMVGEVLFSFNTINGDNEKVSETMDPKRTIDYDDSSGLPSG